MDGTQRVLGGCDDSPDLCRHRQCQPCFLVPDEPVRSSEECDRYGFVCLGGSRGPHIGGDRCLLHRDSGGLLLHDDQASRRDGISGRHGLDFCPGRLHRGNPWACQCLFHRDGGAASLHRYPGNPEPLPWFSPGLHRESSHLEPPAGHGRLLALGPLPGDDGFGDRVRASRRCAAASCGRAAGGMDPESDAHRPGHLCLGWRRLGSRTHRL